LPQAAILYACLAFGFAREWVLGPSFAEERALKDAPAHSCREPDIPQSETTAEIAAIGA
jgi:hypothetical protein